MCVICSCFMLDVLFSFGLLCHEVGSWSKNNCVSVCPRAWLLTIMQNSGAGASKCSLIGGHCLKHFLGSSQVMGFGRENCSTGPGTKL